MPGLGAVEVGAVRGEHVVRDYVERRRHDAAVEGGVEKYLQHILWMLYMEAP